MHITESYIHLKGLQIKAFHGVLPQERIVGNHYEVNLSLACDISLAAQTDKVEHTINYAEVFEEVKTTMEKPCCLIEKVAANIGQNLFYRFPTITKITVEVIKKNPPMGANCAGASVVLHLNK